MKAVSSNRKQLLGLAQAAGPSTTREETNNMEINYSVKYRRLFLPNSKLAKSFAVSFGDIIESDNERVYNLVDMYDAVCYEPDRNKSMEKAATLCREIVELKLKRPGFLKANEKKALNVLYYSLITYEWKEIQHGNKR